MSMPTSSSATESEHLHIETIAESRRESIDWDNLAFGQTPTDHMAVSEYRDGHWADLCIRPYQDFRLSPATHVFHYAQAIFEGMKAYRDQSDDVWLFRPEENWKRFNKSAVRSCMPEVSHFKFIEGIRELLRLDRYWVPTQEGMSMYIRPFMFSTEPSLRATHSSEFIFCIALMPVGLYYSKPLRLYVETEYSRSAYRGGMGGAKFGGNYGGSFYPVKLAKEKGYDQVIWTDAVEHRYIEEVGTMNIFFRIDDTLYTSPTGGSILDGITRKSLITLAEDMGIEVVVDPISIDTITEAHAQGRLKEIFGAGTAAIVSTVELFHHSGQDYELPTEYIGTAESYGEKLRHTLLGIQSNQAPDPHGWRMKV